MVMADPLDHVHYKINLHTIALLSHKQPSIKDCLFMDTLRPHKKGPLGTVHIWDRFPRTGFCPDLCPFLS